MSVKDYYKILEVTPAASPHDIKKSYRRLALKYHPDKNFGAQLYEAKFKEIQEAYHTLSNAKKRQHYNYRRSNYAGSTSHAGAKTYTEITPQTILTQTLDLRKKIAMMDPDRMNKVALFQHVQQLLTTSNIQLLQQHSDHKLNRKIIEELLLCARSLPFANIEQICFQLTAVVGNDNDLYQKIYAFSKEMRLKAYWNKYKLVAAILIALLICVAIYKISYQV